METKGRIIEVKRICGECWREDKIITPLYSYDEEKDLTIINRHNHKTMKIKKEIVEALEEMNNDKNRV